MTASAVVGSAENTLPVRAASNPAGLFELAPGSRLGRYEIVGRLGSGAMGVVFEASDTELDRIVALKLVRPSSHDLEEDRSRLRREAQAMARLSHANVATVFDIGAVGAHLFIAMELVRGGTMRDLVGHDRPWQQQLALLLAAGRGLAAAHEAGVIHRDFKPDNVLVRTDGAIRITDFGLAREAIDLRPDGGPGPTPMRATGVAGTSVYMAPESFDGVADEATDQFAFAVTAFELFEGRRPFDADSSLDVYVRRLRDGNRHFWLRRDLPPWVRAAIDRGLAIDRSARWPSISAMCDAMERIAEISMRPSDIPLGLPAIPAPAPPNNAPKPAPVSKLRLLWPMLTIASIVMTATALYPVWNPDQQEAKQGGAPLRQQAEAKQREEPERKSEAKRREEPERKSTEKDLRCQSPHRINPYDTSCLGMPGASKTGACPPCKDFQ